MENPYLQRYQKSYELCEKQNSLVLNGVLTLSKSPRYIGKGACPVFIEKAKGAYFWDVDNNRYLDFPLALGPVILGYADEQVDEAVRKQMAKGMLYSLSSPAELQLAELLTEVIPCAEKVKFLKSGSEATSAAIRIARAYTGREVVAVCGYHGWHDWTAVRTARNAGIPASLKGLVHEFVYNDLESLCRIFRDNPGKVAAVILEPVGMQAPHDGFLEKVAALAYSHGALVVFDEVITGFRLALGGAQEYFGVTPDLAVFGKAMANGYPLSAVVGKRDIMNAVEERVFISSTNGGDLVSIAAALETISILKGKEGNRQILGLGQKLRDSFNDVANSRRFPASCQGLPHKTFLVFEEIDGIPVKILETIFRQECLARGVFLGYGHFISFSHTEDDILLALSVAEEVMDLMQNALRQGNLPAMLKGEVAEDVFKRY